jgi:hypothetical protein
MATRGPALAALLDGDEAGKIPVAAILMAILQDNYRTVRTPDGEVAVVANGAPSVLVPLKGKRNGLRQRLANDVFQLTRRVASNEALSVLMLMAEGGGADAPAEAAFTRVGAAGGAALLDLGRDDGMTAWVVPGRWGLHTRAPVLWKRGPMNGELPEPCRPGEGTGSRALHLFNYTARGQWVTAMACQVAALLYPASTHPVEIYSADSSGALKTATLRNMKNWLDPGPFVPVPRDGKSWAITASRCHRVAIDNVSAITPWWSDLLCKAASGDSWADRELYMDGDVVAWEFSAVPMLDGIGLVALRDDLADRAVRHHFARPRWFLSDDEVTAAWDREHPHLLGWLLDIAAQVLKAHALGWVARPRTGRMAQFEWVLATLDALWGSGGAGMSWYKASQGEAASDAVAYDPVASVISERVGSWHGYPDELFQKVAPWLPDDGKGPWTVQRFGVWLPRAASALTKLGWTMERSEPDRHRRRKWLICAPDDRRD